MNVAESLARQIARCARLRERNEAICQEFPDMARGMALGNAMLDNAIEQAFVASGSGDPIAVLQAHADLERFEA